jgi:HK97 family phage portal protein
MKISNPTALKIAQKLGLVSKDSQPIRVINDVWATVYSQGVDPPETTLQYLQMYGSIGWVFIAVNKIAMKVASFDQELYTYGRKRAKKVIDKHIFLDTLLNPNDMMSKYELIFRTIQFLELTGSSYWYVSKNIAGGPGLIIPLHPNYVKPVPGKSQLIEGYIYDIGTTKAAYTPEEIIRFVYPHPDPERFYVGASPLQALAYTIAAEQNAEIWNYQWFRNGAVPSGYLSTDLPLEQTEINRLRRMWERQHQGQTNWHKVAVASHGLRFRDIGISHKDMDFLNQLTNARDYILAAYSMPKSIAGLVEDSNRATAFQDEANFATYKLVPATKIISDAVTKHIRQYDERLNFGFKGVVPRDEQRILDENKLYLASGTWVINEVRAAQGMDPVPWGDEPLLNAGMLPLSALGDAAGGGEDNPGSPSSNGKPKKIFDFEEFSVE